MKEAVAALLPVLSAKHVAHCVKQGRDPKKTTSKYDVAALVLQEMT